MESSIFHMLSNKLIEKIDCFGVYRSIWSEHKEESEV